MQNQLKLASVVGARPQFIKAATVSRAIQMFNNKTTVPRPASRIQEVIIHTGQHFDDNMSEVFFRELAIPKPNYNLGVGGGTHGRNTGRMIKALEQVLISEKPHWVLVYGDTDSTLAGALTAAKLHLPVAHVEAGLRSYNRFMPEEINRLLADQLSAILFCPTRTAVANLKKEGFPRLLGQDRWQTICRVGDVMYDAALFYADRAEEKSQIMQGLALKPKGFILATVHRAENTDDPDRLSGIMAALGEIAREVPVILPLHPRTRKKLALLNTAFAKKMLAKIKLIEPVGYLDMVMLEKNARVIVTDSGGVQKEAYFHGVPCVTVRDETEWVELVETGANCVAGPVRQNIIEAFENMKHKTISFSTIYGDGDSSAKIVAKCRSVISNGSSHQKSGITGFEV